MNDEESSKPSPLDVTVDKKQDSTLKTVSNPSCCESACIKSNNSADETVEPILSKQALDIAEPIPSEQVTDTAEPISNKQAPDTAEPISSKRVTDRAEPIPSKQMAATSKLNPSKQMIDAARCIIKSTKQPAVKYQSFFIAVSVT